MSLETRFLLFFALLLFSAPCLAGEEPRIRDVFLVSTLNYADAMVVAPVSARYSIPMLLTDSEQLSFDTKHSLETFKPRRVYLVGGRKVLTEGLESQLGFFDTTRIWGATRYGTAAEVAKAFWPESKKAVLVRDNVGSSKKFFRDVSLASKAASREGLPLLFVYYSKVPDVTAIALRELGVKDVYVYGDYSEKVVQQLGLMGLNIVEGLPPAEEYKGGLVLDERRVLALGEWRDSLYAPFLGEDVVIVSSHEESLAFQDSLRDSNVPVELFGDNSFSSEIMLGLEVYGIEYQTALEPAAFSNFFLGQNWREMDASFFSYVSFVQRTALREQHSLLEARAMLAPFAFRQGIDSTKALGQVDSGISFVGLLVESRNFEQAWTSSFEYKDIVYGELSKSFRAFMDIETS